jgi:hypothetical protein
MYSQEQSGSALTNSSQQRQPALWGTQSTIALQQLHVLNVNDKKIIDNTAAQEFYDHSQRWTRNYTVHEVVSINAQRCISDQIMIDPI